MIKDIKDLNKAIEKLKVLISLGAYEQSELLENEIESYKYYQDIRKTCSRCGAHQTRQGDYKVSFGPPMSQEKLYARVCSFSNRSPNLNKPCINQVTSLPEKDLEELGYKVPSTEEITTKINLESIFRNAGS
jgi:hypothetical protein